MREVFSAVSGCVLVADANAETPTFELAMSLTADIHDAIDASPADSPDKEAVETAVDTFKDMNVTDDAHIVSAVANKFAEKHKETIVETALSGNSDGSDIVPLSDLNSDSDEWIDTVGAVVAITADNRAMLSEFDSVADFDAANGPAIAFKAVLGDGDGVTQQLLVWSKSAIKDPSLIPSDISAGDELRIENTPVADHSTPKFDCELQVNTSSAISKADIDIDVGGTETPSNSGSVHVEGCIVAFGSNSGLIERCQEPVDDSICGTALKKGRCRDHGPVDGKKDLRLKLKVDTGNECITAYTDAKQTETLTGISLEKAKKMALDALDRDVVEQQARDAILHRTAVLTGGWLDDNTLFVEDASIASEYDADLDSALVDARSLGHSA